MKYINFSLKEGIPISFSLGKRVLYIHPFKDIFC